MTRSSNPDDQVWLSQPRDLNLYKDCPDWGPTACATSSQSYVPDPLHPYAARGVKIGTAGEPISLRFLWVQPVSLECPGDFNTHTPLGRE
jgi:hypothetical protein